MISLFAVLIGVSLQIRLWRTLRPQNLVGDEHEYGFPAKPTSTLPFVRVPGQRWFVVFSAMILPGRNAIGARILTSAISLLTLGMATLHVETNFGPGPAIATALVFLLSIERAVLALHLWPDIAMGLLWLGTALLMARHSADSLLPLAIIAAVALILRIDGLAIGVVATIFACTLDDVSLAARLTPLSFCLATALIIILYHRLTKGQWTLDSTLRFNLAVARNETALKTASLSKLMRYTSIATRDQSAPLSWNWSRLAWDFARRLKSLMGPDTFVSQNLLLTNKPAYANTGVILAAPRKLANLRFGFSASFGAMLMFVFFVPSALLVVLAVTVLVFGAVQTRSRYRMGMLPLVAVILGTGLGGFLQSASVTGLSAGAILALLFVLLMVVLPERQEIEP